MDFKLLWYSSVQCIARWAGPFQISGSVISFFKFRDVRIYFSFKFRDLKFHVFKSGIQDQDTFDPPLYSRAEEKLNRHLVSSETHWSVIFLVLWGKGPGPIQFGMLCVIGWLWGKYISLFIRGHWLWGFRDMAPTPKII